MGFIFDSWLESYRRESAWSARLSSDIFFPNHRNILRGLIGRCVPIIACNHADPLHLAGFCCAERIRDALVVHYIYVKFPLREYGVASAMLGAFQYNGSEPIICSHWTRSADGMRSKARLVYNPYLLFSQFSEVFRNERSSEERSTEAAANRQSRAP